MNFPVWLKTPGLAEPAAGFHYTVAENGIFQVRDTAMYRAVTRAVYPIPGLMPEYEQLQLKCPRLPRRLLEDVLAFFSAVYQRYRGEAVVLLFYRTERRQFRIGVPPQTLRGRQLHDGRWCADHQLHYGSVTRPAAFVRCGTIHSHADLPAYASGIDCADERFEDGLHVVFGDFGSRTLSVSAAFVASGVRFRLAPSDVLEPCQIPERPPRAEWMASVTFEAQPNAANDEGSGAVFSHAATVDVRVPPSGKGRSGGIF